MPLKLVPFNPAWISHDKLDLKAIYRRPRWVQDEYGDYVRGYNDDGSLGWDLTPPLPVKQHNKFMVKGYEYVTLANRESLHMAYAANTLIGGTPRDYDQHQAGGPWNARRYMEGAAVEAQDEANELRALVEKHGADVVEQIRGVKLPAALKKVAKK